MSRCNLFSLTKEEEKELEKKKKKVDIFFQDYGFYPDDLQLEKHEKAMSLHNDKTDAYNSNFEEESFRMGYDVIDFH